MATNRINGIVSGMDTETMVKAMVSHQQNQINRLTQKNQKLVWQRERYTDLYSSVTSTRDKLYSYKLDSTTMLKSALSSNESALTVSASSDAAVGTYNLKIHQLAKGAQTGSSAALGSNQDKSTLTAQFGAAYSNDFTLTINGKDIAVKASGSINDMVKQINNSGAGVTASYDSNTDRFFISSNETGADAKIDFTPSATNTSPGDGLDFLQNALKLTYTDADVAAAAAENPPRTLVAGDLKTVTTGQNAIFDLNGVLGIEQSSNSFTISGVTYNLKEADPSKELTVTVNNDNDAIYQSVVNFVNMYNELLEKLNGTMYEQKVSGYDPLTDDQKADMTDDQIEKWETKAKAGILRNDSLLQKLTSDMRTIMYSPVSGISSQMVDGKKVTYNSLFAVGISTGDYSTNGKLVIDETKLKAAIEADPDALNKIINGGTNADGTRTEGVADKLYDRLKIAMDDVNNKSGAAAGGKEITSVLAKQIARNEADINKKITRMNNQMSTYYKQFDAMENLLQQLQSQQDSLTNYLGG